MVATDKHRRPSEFALIAKYFQPLADSFGALGLVDDAARYRPRADFDLVLTQDTIAEGIHFAPDDPPASVARKALRVNLSDLAAKGAKPSGYLLSLALSDDWTEEWVEHFALGLAGDHRTYGISLLGGDTTRAAGGLTITVTAIGEVAQGEMVLRSGAMPGDTIFVSGTIGDAALGLAVRRGEFPAPNGGPGDWLDDRYLHPQPRGALAPALCRYANSAMDVSDGLVGDLAHICDVSGVGAEIDAASVPLSSAARTLVEGNDRAMRTVLTGGDDYEILATVSPANSDAFIRAAAENSIPVTPIGRIVKEKHAPIVLDERGQPIALAGIGHMHF